MILCCFFSAYLLNFNCFFTNTHKKNSKTTDRRKKTTVFCWPMVLKASICIKLMYAEADGLNKFLLYSNFASPMFVGIVFFCVSCCCFSTMRLVKRWLREKQWKTTFLSGISFLFIFFQIFFFFCFHVVYSVICVYRSDCILFIWVKVHAFVQKRKYQTLHNWHNTALNSKKKIIRFSFDLEVSANRKNQYGERKQWK